MSEIEYTRINDRMFVKMELIPDEDAGNPRKEFDNVGTIVAFHNSYDLGDEGHGLSSDMFGGWDELEDYLYKERNAAVVLPLYLYVHSGITISTSSFSCPWDSGQVGFIYCTKEQAVHEWGKKLCTAKVKEKAENYLEGEVKDYDMYLTGDVWGFRVELFELHEDQSFNDLEESEWVEYADYIEEDSCWGHYGSDWAREAALESVYHYQMCYASPDYLRAELEKPDCQCRSERTSTDLRGHRSCFNCYIKGVAARAAKEFNLEGGPFHALIANRLVIEYSDLTDDELISYHVYQRRVGTGYRDCVGQLKLDMGV